MSLSIIKAFLEILRFDIYLACGDFRRFYGRVNNYPIMAAGVAADVVEKVCSAVNVACIWYPKRALCLQRSAVATCLLRRHGVPAQMVIGVQQLPFRAHAWVEIEGRVVNDKSYMPQIYTPLIRC